MTCYVKNLFLLSLLLLLPVTSIFAMQDGQATITVVVDDDYTNEPVEDVLVRLLDNGSEIASGTTDLTGRAELVLSVTSNEELDLIPESFEVSESYPNPFEQSSSVNLQIEEPQEVQAEIYNIIGQRVASLQVNLTPGTYTLQSSLGHLAQGVYFLRILGTQSQTIKMTKVGERIFSGGAILNINPATFVTRNGPGRAALTANGNTARSLTLVTSNGSYDTFQQSLQVASDTTVAVEMSRNNEVIVRVADEASPTQDVETALMVDGDDFSQQITSPDTLTLKSGFYTLSANEDNTVAFSQDVEIASEDQVVTVLTQVKTLANNQLLVSGTIREQDTEEPVNRGYVYLLNSATSDTISGPVFANSSGEIAQIVTFDSGQNQTLDLLYRKAGYLDSGQQVEITLPDTLILDILLEPAPAPVAAFDISGELRAGEPVQFDGSVSSGAGGEDLIYSWDFGNGKKGGGKTIGYIFSNGGDYEVTLTVSGEFGATGEISQSISIQDPPPPTGLATLTGKIFTSAGEGLNGVTVQNADGSISATTNIEGEVSIEGLGAGSTFVLELNRLGYATQYVRTTIPEDTDLSYFEASMVQREEPVVVGNIENGGSFQGSDGVKVNLPVDGFVDQNGDVVTGEVNMSLTPLDVSDENNLRAFPGSFSAVTPNGFEDLLVTFGVAEYEFDRDGESVQLAPGKSAQIEIPVFITESPNGGQFQPGDPFPLWSVDETTGLWVEEGTGTVVESLNSPTGLAFRADVTHFSWWNMDHVPTPYTVIPECKIIDNNGLPTLDIPSGQSCFVRGLPSSSGCAGSNIASTQILSGTTIELPIPPDCNITLLGSSPGGDVGSVNVSGPSGGTVSVTIALEPRSTGIPTITINETEVRELSENTDEFFLDPQGEDLIVLELEKLVSGQPLASLSVFDPNGELMEEIDFDQTDSFSPEKRRILLEIEDQDLHKIEIVHSSGQPLFYSLTILPLQEITLNETVEFEVIKGVSYYQYFQLDNDYIVRSEDGGELFQGNFEFIESFSVLDDSGGPMNLISLRKDSVYVIEHTNIGGPEVLQKEFTLQGALRENLVLKPNNILRIDLIEGGETFALDPGDQEFVIAEINRSQELTIVDPAGNVIDSDSRRVIAQTGQAGNYSINVTPTGESTGFYTLRTNAAEELELNTVSEFTMPPGGRFYFYFRPDRDIVVRGVPDGELLDGDLNFIASMGDFSTPGYRPVVGRMLTANSLYIIDHDNRARTNPITRDFHLTEVIQRDIQTDGGQFLSSGEFQLPNEVHVYTFSAEDGAGIVSELQNFSGNLQSYFIGSIVDETFYEFDQIMNNINPLSTSGIDGVYSILSAGSDDKYGLVLQSSTSNTQGPYDIQVDIASPSTSYVISQDLSCTGATLKAIPAAALAAEENATITLCDGLHTPSSDIMLLSSNITLQGSSPENTIIRREENRRGLIRATNDQFRLADLTIEARLSSALEEVVQIQGNDAIVEDIIMRPVPNLGGYGLGIEIQGDNSIVRNSNFINLGGAGAIGLSGVTNATIENNVFENQGGHAIRSRALKGEITVRNNEFLASESTQAPSAIEFEFDFFDGSVDAIRIFEDNLISFDAESSSPVIETNQTTNQTIRDIIRNNTITWKPRSADRVAIQSGIGPENSSLLIENNVMKTNNTTGGIGVAVNPVSSLGSGSFTVQNNIISDAFKGMRFLSAHLLTSPGYLFNNSFRTDNPGFSQPALGIEITSNNNESGVIPLQVVNNIFQGREGRSDIGIKLDQDLQIDSDYNLFYRIGSNYDSGTTTTGTNDLIADPLFINDMLELESGSPAIDTGATSAEYEGIPDVDINGTARPQGSGIDRGANEKNN